MGKGNSPNFKIGIDRGFLVPGLFKLDHVQPIKPILFQKIFNFSLSYWEINSFLPQRVMRKRNYPVAPTCDEGSSWGQIPPRGARISPAACPGPPARRSARPRSSCRESCQVYKHSMNKRNRNTTVKLHNHNVMLASSPASEKLSSTLRSRRNSLASPRNRLSHAASNIFTAPSFLGIFVVLAHLIFYLQILWFLLLHWLHIFSLPDWQLIISSRLLHKGFWWGMSDVQTHRFLFVSGKGLYTQDELN